MCSDVEGCPRGRGRPRSERVAMVFPRRRVGAQSSRSGSAVRPLWSPWDWPMAELQWLTECMLELGRNHLQRQRYRNIEHVLLIDLCYYFDTSTTLIASWLDIRSRCCQISAGGSLPPSIGNLAQLLQLCGVSADNHIVEVLSSSSILPSKYSTISPGLEYILVLSSYVLIRSLFLGTLTLISSWAPSRLSLATSLSCNSCTLRSSLFHEPYLMIDLLMM